MTVKMIENPYSGFRVSLVADESEVINFGDDHTADVAIMPGAGATVTVYLLDSPVQIDSTTVNKGIKLTCRCATFRSEGGPAEIKITRSPTGT